MLNTLKNIIQEVNAAESLESVLQIIVDRVTETIDASACNIYLLDLTQQRYSLSAAKGLNESAVGKISLGADEGLIGFVGSRAEPVNLEDAKLHPSFYGFPELNVDDYHAFLGVPIIHRRKVLGVLGVKRLERHRFDINEEAFLVTLATQLASVIAHSAIISTQDVGRSGAEQANARFKGVAGAPGVAVGRAVVMYPSADLNAVPDRIALNIDDEITAFQAAVEAVRKEIHALQTKLRDDLQTEHDALFDSYLQMLGQQALSGEIEERIRQGYWAQSALKYVVSKRVSQFNNMQDDYLRERGADVKQLGQHILANLQQVSQHERSFPEQTILIAEELTPAMLGKVPRENLAGMASMSGSANSHIAILARALNVPTVMGAIDLPYLGLEERDVVIDGFYGRVHINPSSNIKMHYQAIIKSQQEFSDELKTTQDLPCETSDGHRIHLWANINLNIDVHQSLDQGAEGIGLYRTEFPFMYKEHFPTEDEQFELYRKDMEKFTPRDITMRTLDIGGDKSLPYFPITEANPFLGWRGIRVTLDHPEILAVQVRAMLKAHAGMEGKLRIMLPMVTDIREVKEARQLIMRCYQEVMDEGYAGTAPLIGAMIEVPAAVYQVKTLAEQTDFLAVGSNDLTQYILAVDRNNARVAELYNELHPAMLKALKDIVDTAHRVGTSISICGELAANPSGCVLLIAMGYDILSMNAVSLPRIRWLIRNLSMAKARELLAEAMMMDDAEEVVDYMEKELTKAGLKRLLRPKTLPAGTKKTYKS